MLNHSSLTTGHGYISAKGMVQQSVDTLKEKPLIHLKIKMGEGNVILANVYKDDTAATVADRVFR